MMGDERGRKREDTLMEGKKDMQHCQGMSIDSEILGVWKKSSTTCESNEKSNDYHLRVSNVMWLYLPVMSLEKVED